jgi:hypothetical protein
MPSYRGERCRCYQGLGRCSGFYGVPRFLLQDQDRLWPPAQGEIEEEACPGQATAQVAPDAPPKLPRTVHRSMNSLSKAGSGAQRSHARGRLGGRGTMDVVTCVLCLSPLMSGSLMSVQN